MIEVFTVNVGPLPTAFTPATHCAMPTIRRLFSAAGPDGKDFTEIELIAAYTCDGKPFIKEGCLPSAYAVAYGVIGPMWPVLSPGNACPVGYGPSCTMVHGTSLTTTTSAKTDDIHTAVLEDVSMSMTKTARHTEAPPPPILWKALAQGEIAIGCCPK